MILKQPALFIHCFPSCFQIWSLSPLSWTIPPLFFRFPAISAILKDHSSSSFLFSSFKPSLKDLSDLFSQYFYFLLALIMNVAGTSSAFWVEYHFDGSSDDSFGKRTSSITFSIEKPTSIRVFIYVLSLR